MYCIVIQSTKQIYVSLTSRKTLGGISDIMILVQEISYLFMDCANGLQIDISQNFQPLCIIQIRHISCFHTTGNGLFKHS